MNVIPPIQSAYMRPVTTKGQVTIPVEIRRMLDIEPGEVVQFKVKGKKVELHTARLSLEDTFGAVRKYARKETKKMSLKEQKKIALKEQSEKTLAEMEQDK